MHKLDLASACKKFSKKLFLLLLEQQEFVSISYLPPNSFPIIGTLANGFEEEEEVALPVLFAAPPAVLFAAPPAEEVILLAFPFTAAPADFKALLALLVAFFCACPNPAEPTVAKMSPKANKTVVTTTICVFFSITHKVE
jgi:hypothetical protein